MADTARVLEIQRMSTEDGPGIRSTLFFKGCSLRCGWCHNPESIPLEPQLIWREVACIGCRSCVEACPEQARALGVDGAAVDPDACTVCGTCARECPGAAIAVLGEDRTVDDVVVELLKDRAYFEESGGGVTLSGGEPVLWAGFAGEVLDRVRAVGVHAALDTCGACSPRKLVDLAQRADLVLFDLKQADSERHRELTGQLNERILDNLRLLVEAGVPLWIRTPLIPDATATGENLRSLGALIADLGDAVLRWELCAFNNLCRDKYRRLGRPWPWADVPLLTADELAGFERVAKTSGVDPELVIATGPTRRSTC